jgi:hypothetical protein
VSDQQSVRIVQAIRGVFESEPDIFCYFERRRVPDFNNESPSPSPSKEFHKTKYGVGETGVKRDTGSKGTVGGKIVDVNKTLKFFSILCKSV